MPRTKLTEKQKRELREQAIEPVKALMEALQAAGMTRVEAAKTVRYATHVISPRSDG